MKNDVSYKARYTLISMGKTIPFALCGLLLVTYMEKLFTCFLSDFLMCGGYIIPNTPFSFLVAYLFEYDILLVVVTLIISVAIRACRWNLYAIFYLFTNLMEKYIFDFEIEMTMVYVIISMNILISGYFLYKGIKASFNF